MSVVTLKYEDLVAGKDLSADIYKAYGPNGLGALLISGIPQYKQLREELLPLGYKLAHIPGDKLKKYEDPNSLWNAGWSHGKEKLGDEPDFAKGSFYANPLYDTFDEADRTKYPVMFPNNIWPTEEMPELEPRFKELGRVMYDTVVLLAKQIDQLVEKSVPTYPKGSLHQQMSQTKKIKGRLLYYYPTDTDKEDGWIGWHNDSGFLTALTSAMFYDDESGENIANPDPNGGLWIVDRGNAPVNVKIPADCLAVQCGECLQIMTGGLLVATPHSVRPSKSDRKIGRSTFPVFIDVHPEFPLVPPQGISRDAVFDKTIDSRVPPLQSRWHEGQPFHEFLSKTFEQYYKWNFGAN